MERDKKNRIVIFISLFLVRMIVILGIKGLVQDTGGDEFGTLFGATIFTDLDWSVATSRNSYYGIGYSILLTPFFSIIHNTQIIMKICMIANSLCLGISGVFCYNILRKFFECDADRTTMLITYVSVCVSSNLIQLNSFTNEAALYLIMWIIIYLLLALSEDDDKYRKANTFFLVAILAYGMTVHTRMIFLIGFTILYIGIYAFLRKKIIVSVPIGVITVCLMAFFVYFTLNCIENTFFLSSSAKNVNNSVGSAVNSVGGILKKIKKENMLEILKVFQGQIFSAIVVTYGIIIICFRSVLKYIKDIKEKKLEGSSLQVLTIALFVLWMTIIVMFSIKQGGYIVKHPSKTFSKYYMYVRYQNICMQPLVMVSLLTLIKNKEYEVKERLNKLSRDSIFISFLMLNLFLLIHNSKINTIINTSSHAYYDYLAFQFLKKGDHYSILRMSLYCIIILAIIIVCYSFIRRRYIDKLMFILLSASLYCYFYTSFVINIPNSIESFDYYNRFINIIKEEEHNHIYMITKSYTHFCNMQFYIYDQLLEEVIPEEISEPAIIIVEGTSEERSQYSSLYRSDLLLDDDSISTTVLKIN